MLPTAQTHTPANVPGSTAALNLEMARRAEIRAGLNPQHALSEQLRRDVSRAEAAQRLQTSRQAQQQFAGRPTPPNKLPIRSTPLPQRVNYGPPPVNNAYTPGANYRPGGGTSAIAAKNAAAAAGATGAQAAAAARAAAPTVITPAMSARGALAGAPLIGAGMAGALTAGGIKAAGGSWWEAGGGALGAAGGAILGQLGGAAAGAFASANPAGAVVGGYLGAGAGAIAGGALGQRAGGALGRIPGVGGKIAGLASGAIAPLVPLAPLANFASGWIPPEQVAGDALPSTTVPVEGPAPFAGGQMPGVTYRFLGSVNFTIINCNTGAVVPSTVGASTEFRLVGPISGMNFSYDTPGPCGNRRIIWTWNTGAGVVSGGSFLNALSNVRLLGGSFSGSFERAGGLPDTGGNPPGPITQAPAPSISPRVPYRPAGSDGALNPFDRPSGSAPAPNNNGSLAPAIRPKAPPSTAPAAPNPGPALPAGDPLADPLPQVTPDPTAPPQATPENVPGPVKAPAPETYKGLRPGESVNLSGGGKVTATAQGYRVEVPLDSPNRIELPNGDIIGPGEVGEIPEADRDLLPWLIPALAIGGAAGVATALKVGNPTAPGEFVQVPPTPPQAPRPSPPDTGCRCNAPLVQGQKDAAADINDLRQRLVRVEGNQNNPTSGFGALQAGNASILAFLQTMNQFLRKAWETTRMQKVLDVLTFIGVMHNVSMLSRDIGETFFYLIAQGLDIVGIENEEGGPLDVGQIVGSSVNNFLIGVFGEAFVEGARDAYRKANRIVQSASMVIWTVRSLQDTGLDLMEWIGENTGKIGNALKRFGVVGERSYPWMAESAQARARNRARFDKVTNALENAEDRLSSYSIATSNVLEIQQETQELGENWGQFKESLNEVPDPWFSNQPVENQALTEVAASASPNITALDAERSS